MVAVPDDVGELSNPIAKNDHTCLFGELQIDLDVAVAVNEIVDVRMILDVLLREEHQVFAILPHICRFLVISALQTAVLGPVQTEPHTPAGMKSREGPLTGTVMKDASDELETLVGIAQAIAMRKEEYLAVEFGGLRLLVEDDATLFFKIAVSPDVVVACEIMHLDAHVGADQSGV